MIKTWRWFGKKDPITLEMLRQIGVEGIVTALYDLPPGEVWSPEAIEELKQTIEGAGLVWSVAESLPVAEEIKYAAPTRDRLIHNYNMSLMNLGRAGIKTICYNFMPAIDWVRTDLNRELPDGTTTLYFDRIRYAFFDCRILQREGAEADYSAEELRKIELLDKTLTKEEKEELIDTIIVKTQGFIHRKMKEGADPVTEFRKLLHHYKDIDRDELRKNLTYFLNRVIPVAEAYGIMLCIHPDDPPFPVFGLPRIVSREEDLEWIIGAVNNHSNGITFCAGSLSAIAENDVPRMAQLFAKRIGFAHLRSTALLPDGNFMEAFHLDGNGRLIEVIRELERSLPEIPMRVDHGRVLPGDREIAHNPGYTFYGRMFALAQVEGMMAVVRNEIEAKRSR
ncbi:mannonate dehydratase [Dysgonomonadaceae bacterium zrk40]|nr:mannonate dehydratase [Dysgonomonadaceae bacterium zrk40]